MRNFELQFFSICLLMMTGNNGATDPLPTNCGRSVYDDIDYASNSTLPRIGEFPWLARIGLYDKATKSKYFFCTGSLIHATFVLTAGHCGEFGELVRLGVNNPADSKECPCGPCPPHQDISVVQHLFADHCRVSKSNDISLLVLKKRAKFNELVRPICLYMEMMLFPPSEEEVVTAAGWGTVYSGWGKPQGINHTSLEKLRYVNVSILHPTECSTFYSRGVESNELCVGFPKIVKSPCVSDSGGPIVIRVKEEKEEKNRKHLLGIASHDLQLCRSSRHAPVLYTDVTYFHDWITMKISSW